MRYFEIGNMYFDNNQGEYIKPESYDDYDGTYFCERFDLDENDELVLIDHVSLTRNEVKSNRFEKVGGAW